MSTPQEWLDQMCQCTECAGSMEPTVGNIEYDLEDMTIVVEDVPMKVCTACGFRTIPGVAAMAIDEVVQDFVRSERSHNVVDRATLHYREREQALQHAYAD